MKSSTEMPFLDHLGELRSRIWWTLVGVIVGSVLAFFWAGPLLAFITAPIRENFTIFKLIGTGVADAFITRILVSIVAGVLLSLPNSFYQLWIFVSPGMHEHERKLALPFVAASTFCFLFGALFCYYLVLPVAFRFFSAEFTAIDLSPEIRIAEYLSFVVKLILVFGIMFELPMLVFLLGRLGLITHQQLRNNFRVAILVIFIIAAVVTPPDAVSQLMLAIPLCGLYWCCIYVCKCAETMRANTPPAST